MSLQSEDEIQGKVDWCSDFPNGTVLVLIKNKVLCLKKMGQNECLVKVQITQRVTKNDEKQLVECLDTSSSEIGLMQAFVGSKNGFLTKITLEKEVNMLINMSIGRG